jgi:3-hydroxybutyryl-CoA dehydratase
MAGGRLVRGAQKTFGNVMQDFYVKVGDAVTFAKTVGETDIYLFAGITGDFSVNHVNEQYMARSKFGRRIAHGALIVGYMSTCSTMMIEKSQSATADTTPVSLGYDRVRFLAPVFIGDTVTLTYTIAEVDPQKRQSLADIAVVNQNGVHVAVACHILRWVDNTRSPED